MKNGLLIGGYAGYLGELAQQVASADVLLHIATNLDDVKRIFKQDNIDIVFMGRESFPEERLCTLEFILMAGFTPPIHLMGKGDDPVRFVQSVLRRESGKI